MRGKLVSSFLLDCLLRKLKESFNLHKTFKWVANFSIILA